jgi:SAM-dependent methyltransferase
MVHEGPEPSDPNQGPVGLGDAAVPVLEGAVAAPEVSRPTPLPNDPRLVARTTETPAVRTTGPLLPMRIIGVNAVHPHANHAPPSAVARATPMVPAVGLAESGDTADASKSQRTPASIPPPKPPSGRAPKNAEETPLGGLEVALHNATGLTDFSLRAPAIPLELEDQIELTPESSRDDSDSRVTPVPSGPPPLPPERRTSGQAPRELDETPPFDEQSSGAPAVPALHAAWGEGKFDDKSDVGDLEPASVEPASLEVTESEASVTDTQSGRAQMIQDGLTPGPRSDRSKPPALPSRPKRADVEGRLGGEPVQSKPTQSVPSQPAPPAPERSKAKKRRPPPIPPPRVAFTSGAEEEQTKRRHWWEEVFGDDFLRANADLTDRQLLREVEFIERSLNVERSAAVLDLACGSGRHAIELNRRGYVTVGYDLSVTQLARASESAQAEGVKVSLLQGDMREMAFDQMFDAVICWNASFGYFEEEKNVAVLKNIHRALKPGGCFLLDIPNRDFIVAHQPAQNWFEGDGCVCMDDMHVDFITSRLCVKRTIMLDDGRNKECLYSIRLFGLHELGRMLHEIGFRVNEVSGHIATRGVFMGATSPRLIITVTKR